MDTSARFFTKLRNLSVSLQTETASLQNTYQNFDDGENTEGAVRVLHELHSEVRGLKEQVQSQLVRQQAEESDVRSFIKSCMVLKQRNTEDILRLRRHYEKYGYQAPKNTQKQSEVKGDDAEASANGDKEEDETEGEEEDQGEGPQEHLPPMTPFKMPHLRPEDPMRTPQLSDFGLSEIALERVLGGAGFSCEAAPTPMMSLSPPSLVMAMQPPMPKTPKCTLRMDEDDPQTPRIEDFGISEHTMCLNNDFTMDLHRRKATKTASLAESSSLGGLPQRPAHSLSQQHSVMHCLATDESMESPEPPVFCTPGFTITRSHGSSAQPLQGDNVPESPCFNHQATPEAPVFETPYINRLLSTRKGARADDATDTQEDEAPPSEHLPSNRRAEDFSSAWCYNVPEIALGCSEDNATPEMPSLESYFGSSLPKKAVGWIGVLPEHREGSGERLFPSLEQDGPTQTFNLGTPRVRGGYPEPSTPEMPDLSSVTQDICKLISQCKKPTTAGVNPLPKPAGKENRRAHSLAQVSEKEFLSLPSYLRQVPLSSLNQAIQSINTATEEKHYVRDEILMEELRRITGVGTKAPMYFLCLTELKRLEHIHGMGINSTYRVLSHS